VLFYLFVFISFCFWFFVDTMKISLLNNPHFFFFVFASKVSLCAIIKHLKRVQFCYYHLLLSYYLMNQSLLEIATKPPPAVSKNSSSRLNRGAYFNHIMFVFIYYNCLSTFENDDQSIHYFSSRYLLYLSYAVVWGLFQRRSRNIATGL